MNALLKFSVFVLFIMLSIVVSGLYGAVHNQISYTVAPEYFTKFKFNQFDLVDTRLPDRVRASMVGFFASWWMGIPIGVLLGAAGFMHRGWRRMLRFLLWSMLLVIAFTFLFGLAGLLYGYIRTAHIEIAEYRYWYIPEDVSNMRRFLCVDYMHNASYLGGVLAILAAWTFHIIVRVRTKEKYAINSGD